MIENQNDPLSFPHAVLPGALIMAFRQTRVREIGLMSYRKERQTFTVRAVLSDRPQPSNCSLEEVVTFAPNTHVILTEGTFPAFKYYSSGRAVLFDLLCDDKKYLTHIQTYVSAKLPELALGYAPAAISQFIDTLAMHTGNPLAIQRMELLSPADGGVLAFQITVPRSVTTDVKRFHSLRAGGPFLNTEAIYREAITNPSPYYRLLLAFRGFEGVQQVRNMVRKLATDLKIAEKLPKAVRVDELELARLGFHPEVRGLKDSSALFGYYQELRNAVAHFLLDQKGSAPGSLHSRAREFDHQNWPTLII